MSYKPLSQTVTDGQKNPISSDAVNDHVAAEIAAIPSPLPVQTNNDDRVLVTDGTDDSWQYAGLGSGNFGTNNIILGRGKPTSFTTAASNIIINTSTTNTMSSASSNVVIGTAAGNALSTGSNNTIVGENAGNKLTTAGANTLIGRTAGFNLTTGYSNAVVGHGALSSATTGNQNAVFGVASLNGVTTGSFNSGFGHELTNQAGAFGYGGVKLVTGSYNTFLGSHAGTMAADTSNAIVFGFNSIANSNECAIGGYNTHAPNRVAGRISTIFVGRGGREIPFNVATPVQILTQRATGTDTQLSAASLVLAGAAGTGTGIGSPVIIATAPASASTGSSLNAHVQRIRIEHDGRVGIGTPNPEAKLEVAGKVKVYDGDLEIGTLGKGLKIAEGANATVGVETLVAGVATVNTSAVQTNSRILLTNQNPSGTVGFLHVSARTAGTSFEITSSNAADTSDIAWMIVNPLTVTDSDADTFITNASITDATQKRAIQRLVKSLKDESLWAKMKVIYPMVGGTEAAHKLNLKDPQDTDAAFRLVFVGHLGGPVVGITHNSRGIRFGGVSNTGLGDTKFVPDTHFTAVDNFHISCYMYYDTEDFRNGIAIGAATSGGGNLYFQPDSENASYTINSVTSTMDSTYKNFPVSGRPKSTFMLMDSGADKRGYLRTVHKDLYEIWARGAAATGTLPTHSLMLNGFNNNGTPSWGWASQDNYFKTMQFVTIGDSLTTLEAYKLHAIIEQFQLELGRQV